MYLSIVYKKKIHCLVAICRDNPTLAQLFGSVLHKKNRLGATMGSSRPTPLIVRSRGKSVYLWPIILIGPLFALLSLVVPGNILQALYTVSWCLVLLVIVDDFPRNKFLVTSIITALVLALFGLLGYMFLTREMMETGLSYLRPLWEQPFSPVTACILSVFCAGLWVWDFADAHLNHTYKFENGEILSVAWASKDNDFHLEQCQAILKIADWWEWLLGYGGEIEIRDRVSAKPVVLLHNVMWPKRTYQKICEHLPSDASDRR